MSANPLSINENFKKEILESIPDNLTNLEKAVHIYTLLCQKLDYSLNFYMDNTRYSRCFEFTRFLMDVDGKNNKDVVCYTFIAIFTEMLVSAKICDYDDFDYSIFYPDDGRFDPLAHLYITNLKIDGKNFSVNPVKHILGNNDLVTAKFNSKNLTGFDYAETPSEAEKQQLVDILTKTRASLYKPNDAAEEFVAYAQELGAYKEFPIEFRFEFFLSMLEKIPNELSIKTLSEITVLRHKCFKFEERHGKKRNPDTNGKKHPVYIIKDKSQYHEDLGYDRKFETVNVVKHCEDTDKLKVLIFYNCMGYNDDFGYENFDTLEVYEFDLETKEFNAITLEELQNRVKNHVYTAPYTSGAFKTLNLHMATPGNVYIAKTKSGTIKRIHLFKQQTETLTEKEAQDLTEQANQVKQASPIKRALKSELQFSIQQTL